MKQRVSNLARSKESWGLRGLKVEIGCGADLRHFSSSDGIVDGGEGEESKFVGWRVKLHVPIIEGSLISTCSPVSDSKQSFPSNSGDPGATNEP